MDILELIFKPLHWRFLKKFKKKSCKDCYHMYGYDQGSTNTYGMGKKGKHPCKYYQRVN